MLHHRRYVFALPVTSRAEYIFLTSQEYWMDVIEMCGK